MSENKSPFNEISVAVILICITTMTMMALTITHKNREIHSLERKVEKLQDRILSGCA